MAGQDGVMDRRDLLRRLALLGTGALFAGEGAAFIASQAYMDLARPTRTVTDDWGRTVAIPSPSHLRRVYFSGPIGQIILFTLRPELIAGTTLPFTPAELSMLPAGTETLPFMGSLSEDVALDIDAMREEGIQLVLSSVGDDDSIEAIEDPDEFQERCGIPVVQFKAGFETMGDAYREIGAIVGAEARAEELARYLEGIYSQVSEAVASVPVERRVRLYYAEGPEGLQTEPFSSAHAHTFSVAGAYNVAEVARLDARGKTAVTIEQVRAWNPHVIVAWDDEVRDGAAGLIRSDPDWRGIAAVDSGRVYTMPNVPYSWCDRPAGPNRCIGIQWVANMLYPDHYAVDMAAATQEFYRTMWRLDISRDEALALLGSSYAGH